SCCGISGSVKFSVKVICKPTSSPDAFARAAARSESSMNTIALAALIRLAAKQAMIRSVAIVQRPRSSAFMVSMGLRGEQRTKNVSQRMEDSLQLRKAYCQKRDQRSAGCGGVTRSREASGFPLCNCAHL